jgi:hypothetical protein
VRLDRPVPSVAAKKRACLVARLADIPDIRFASRLASIALFGPATHA